MTKEEFQKRVDLMQVHAGPAIDQLIDQKIQQGLVLTDLYSVVCVTSYGTVVAVNTLAQIQAMMNEYGEGTFRDALEDLLAFKRPSNAIVGLFIENDNWAIAPARLLNSLGGTA